LAELLSITEPRAAQLAPPSLGAFLQMGFRPLYLGGACWAALSIAIWIFVPAMLQGVMQGVLWHAHEMLWGFITTIAVGFLLTAGATWTGINPLHGRPLGLLCCLWAFARLAFLVPGRLAFLAGAAAELAYFALAGVAMRRAVLKSRNRRNYGVPWLLFALGVFDALYLLAATAGSPRSLLMQFFEAALLCMAIIALLVGRRVIPFFAMRALPGLVLPMHTRSGHWQIAAATLAIALLLSGHGDWAVFPLTLAAAIGLLQTLAWQPWAARHTPLLWILHAGYAAAQRRLAGGGDSRFGAAAARGPARARHRDGWALGAHHRHDHPHRPRPPGARAGARSLDVRKLLAHARGRGASSPRAAPVRVGAPAARRRGGVLDQCVCNLPVAVCAPDDPAAPRCVGAVHAGERQEERGDRNK